MLPSNYDDCTRELNSLAARSAKVRAIKNKLERIPYPLTKKTKLTTAPLPDENPQRILLSYFKKVKEPCPNKDIQGPPCIF